MHLELRVSREHLDRRDLPDHRDLLVRLVSPALQGNPACRACPDPWDQRAFPVPQEIMEPRVTRDISDFRV